MHRQDLSDLFALCICQRILLASLFHRACRFFPESRIDRPRADRCDRREADGSDMQAKRGVECQHRYIHFNLQKSHYRNPEVVLEITRNAPKNLTPLPLPPSLAHSTAHVLKAAKPAVLVAEYNILVGAGTRAATEERW